MKLFKKRGALKTATDLELNNAEQYFENIKNDNEELWFDQDYEEGQLSIDVYQTADKLIIKSTIAGVKPEDIDISVNNDMLTIRGKREMEETVAKADYLYKECYWGSFSRSLILPLEIRTDKLEAFLENGVLTISMLKSKKPKQQVTIKVKER
ncbi:MAG: Protein containing Heat shock protein Hsp20 protein [Parcubacteria group bacterium GW2011_GWE2_38_18]|nr:MAG: Protein containing Heat shock protein Hsp20 protein [Parcubacteria group bacterium GW2011_GWE2_38_18]